MDYRTGAGGGWRSLKYKSDLMKEVSIFWFRRDLRLDDNTGLFHALNSSYPVLPIFIFDTEILSTLKKDDSRVTFIFKQLMRLQKELKNKGSSIAVYFGKPIDIFQELTGKYRIQKVFTNRDYEPYARIRDKEIGDFLTAKNISFHLYKDQVIFEKSEVVKQDGGPYVVYTPYMKIWKQLFRERELQINASEKKENFLQEKNLPFPELMEIGFVPSKITVPIFDLSEVTISNYQSQRNFPHLDSTSRIGPHLRFGTISIRKVVQKAASDKNETFLQELIWREFFMQILYHFPNTVTESFKPKYDRIPWRNNEAEFELWKAGKTGYALVDAGMRQLNTTGFMHNRVRMLVASFLCKHLLIDWRWGEAYFAEKLLDYELSSNVGNWQWAAGSGVDAAPYFRIFNPITQVKDYDKDELYIKKWVPNYGTEKYPEMMVDHKEGRERALKVYKEALAE